MQRHASIARADQLERDHEWLVIAGRHWSTTATTANDFARHAVGRLLIEDLATPRKGS